MLEILPRSVSKAFEAGFIALPNLNPQVTRGIRRDRLDVGPNPGARHSKIGKFPVCALC